MTDQGLVPPFGEPETSATGLRFDRVIQGRHRSRGRTRQDDSLMLDAPAVPAERKRMLISTIDKSVVIVLALLLSIGLMMVYSTTFDWSYQEFGSETTIFTQHLRNMIIGVVFMFLLMLIDYRVWRKFAVLLLLITYALLVGVLIFGDRTFNAQRSFFNGSYQPGELAELIVVVYMAAWLGSKNTRIRKLTHGLLPYGVLIGSMSYLIIRQPDLSTVAMIVLVSGIMLFLAGADLLQLGIAGAIAAIAAIFLLSNSAFSYAQNRVDDYVSGAADITESSWHVQQAVLAFNNGGWTGVGLGQGRQKFGALPAPHTDSIFAVIGEELGVVGALMVVGLYMVLAIRGFMIARRAPDTFGSLLASGVTVWIIAKAMLNIAVMTAVVPATGASLPFISFGGSSLVVVMAGAGLLLSVARVTAKQPLPERRTSSAPIHLSRGDRGPRLSSDRSSGGD